MELNVGMFAQFGVAGIFLFLTVKAIIKLYNDAREDSKQREEAMRKDGKEREEKLMEHLDRVADTLDRVDDRLENMECRITNLERISKKEGDDLVDC